MDACEVMLGALPTPRRGVAQPTARVPRRRLSTLWRRRRREGGRERRRRGEEGRERRRQTRGEEGGQRGWRRRRRQRRARRTRRLFGRGAGRRRGEGDAGEHASSWPLWALRHTSTTSSTRNSTPPPRPLPFRGESRTAATNLDQSRTSSANLDQSRPMSIDLDQPRTSSANLGQARTCGPLTKG